LLTALSMRADVKVILLPRNEAQRADFEARKLQNMIIPREALDSSRTSQEDERPTTRVNRREGASRVGMAGPDITA